MIELERRAINSLAEFPWDDGERCPPLTCMRCDMRRLADDDPRILRSQQPLHPRPLILHPNDFYRIMQLIGGA